MTKKLGDEVPQFNMDRFDFFRPKSDFQVHPILTRRKQAKPFCFILGAQDPEMDEIEKLLRENGEAYRYAEYDGKRSLPWNSYIANSVWIPPDTVAVLVECEPVQFEGCDAVIRIIDHHRPGDPGHDCSPEEYWEASSIGQVYKLLNSVRSQEEQLKPKHGHLVLAALDHCSAQARLGKCPGIDPKEVRELSINYTAQGKGMSIMSVEATVKHMYSHVLGSKKTLIGAQLVIDLTHTSIGLGYSLEFLCLQEAINDLGQVGLVKTKNRIDGPDKIIICGAAAPETIRYFMKSWAPNHGLKYIYGVPARGYAGGYRS